MLSNDDMLQFVKVFKGFNVFSPFLHLLQLNLTVDKVWPIYIDRILNLSECELVRKAAFLSRTVEFFGNSCIIQTITNCNISQIHKVNLILDDFDFTLIMSNDLKHLAVSTLCLPLYNDIDTEKITGAYLAASLQENRNVKSLNLILNITDFPPTFRLDLFNSVGSIRGITSFGWTGDEVDVLSKAECKALGMALRASNITTLELKNLTWAGLVELSASLPQTAVQTLKVAYVFSEDYLHTIEGHTANIAEEVCVHLAQEFLNSIASSNVKHLEIVGSKLADSFAIQLSTTKGLNLSSLNFSDNALTLVGLHSLLQMDMQTLRVLNVESNRLTALAFKLRRYNFNLFL